MQKMLDLKHKVKIGARSYLLSTVGLKYFLGDYPFETMVFTPSYSELYCERYKTEAEAVAQHKKLAAEMDLGVKFWEGQR